MVIVAVCTTAQTHVKWSGDLYYNRLARMTLVCELNMFKSPGKKQSLNQVHYEPSKRNYTELQAGNENYIKLNEEALWFQ